MDQQRERIREDLRGLVDGEVRCDTVFLQLYATDASIHRIEPLVVVCPRSTADVVACVQYAAQNHLPVHARGAGTGLAGESLGPGVVLDFSKHLRRVLRAGNNTVRVQPGLVLGQLNALLRRQQRVFGPDPATGSVTTIGGLIGIDAAGSRRLKYGSTGRHVVGLQIVLADGQVLEVGREPLATQVSDGAAPRKQELVGRVADILTRHADLIRRRQPAELASRCGYNLVDVLSGLSGGHLDLARLLVGSEGTLALVTEAELSTEPLPRHRGVVLLLFNSLENASRAVLEILPFEPSACDMMDRRHLSLARETEVRYDLLIPVETEAVLLVEQEGDNPLEVRDRLRRIVEQVRQQKRLAFDARQAFDAEEMDLFWQLGRKVVPTLYGLKGASRPLPFVEDIVVPPQALPGFLVRMQNVLKRHQVIASLFGHPGHGQLHLRPFLDLANPEDVRKMPLVAEELYREVVEAGGAISAEHGVGLSRTAYLPSQYGELCEVFRGVKRIFDPENILNPGKIVGDDPHLLTRNLRSAGSLPSPPTATEPGQPAPAEAIALGLNWTPMRITDTAQSCNGCGVCRSLAPELRMCPMFRFAPAEEASPRAKANLVRGVLTGQIDPLLLAKDEFKAVADLCVHCQSCRLECPARVDIPKLMVEAKGAYVSVNGLSFTDGVLARLEMFSTFGSLLSPLANRALGNRQLRWLIEKLSGIAQGRKLPRFAPRSFIRRAARRQLTRPTRRSGGKVLYFVDTYANHHDPQLAEALVAVLEHNGVAVYVHPAQMQAGMPLIALGAIDRARRLAEHNVALLAEAVRQGYHIVASEPAAAMCLAREYPSLVSDDDAQLVAKNASEACTYLWKRHLTGKLQLDLKPVNATVGYHLPCMLRGLEVGSPGENLLRLIPGLAVHRQEKGCCGMAGAFGLKRANYRSSLRAGWGLISSLRHPLVQAGATECSACKIQMEQGTSKPTLHPLKLLALAYGLMPEVATLLGARGQERVVT
ncbi:MAG: FAD-linked oxidase C-terminal domain-containing protein [Pirellulales bacterium]